MLILVGATSGYCVCVGLMSPVDWGSSDDELAPHEAISAAAGPDGVSYQSCREMFLRAVLMSYAGADVLIREMPMEVNESPIPQRRVVLLPNGVYSPKRGRTEGFYISSDAFALIASDVFS